VTDRARERDLSRRFGHDDDLVATRIEIVVLASADVSAGLLASLRALLDDAFADGFSEDDWAHTLGGTHVVALDGDDVVAHAAVVTRDLDIGERRWRAGYVEGVATARSRQRSGLGTAVMDEARRVVQAGFELGALSTSVHPFYERLGWERWQGPSSVRRSTGTVRTPHEDDGIMVLRFGPSATVDLTAPITCESRRGDDW
jgi:aminoglycoside 2'-N-acetyltransferase I